MGPGSKEVLPVRVTVAIVPPEPVLDHVEAALARSPVPPGEFEPVARGSLMIPVFSLGNVTRPEASAVAEFLHAELDRSRPPPQVHFEGVLALEAEGDLTVGLPLAGDVDRVNELARSMWDLVMVRGYFVDRRRWAPRLTVGSVTASTSLPFLERLVADLGQHASPPWPVSSIVFVRRRFDGDDPDTWDVVEEIPTSVAPA
jgi:2'-5' RNA ligase